MELPLRCRHCGEIIGAYEPVVVRSAAGVWRTYRAMAQIVARDAGDAFHAACHGAFQAAAGEPESPSSS
jgi:hypothetical protein